ncbi:MAG: hypothetical protein IPN29_06260 [Saprospiraceae bacterium]|nr:hypothetical protein [Saprospiraceae bacterium]
MLKQVLLFIALLMPMIIKGQTEKPKDAFKFNLNEDGSHFFQLTFLNQTWVRYNQSNEGTMVQGREKDNTFDIGLRRTRIQMFGQINERVFLYFQFGQNNFNAQYNLNANRKNAAFFHDAICEYRLSKANQLKIGAGLTIANGLSRFSQPSIGTITTLDVPVFAQSSVDQTDLFSRKLSVYARGQLGQLDYRIIVSDPFPVNSSGTAPAPLNENASFALKGHSLQMQALLIWQFFEHESHLTPYMAGTSLGKKKIFNIAAEAIYQGDAMWKKEGQADTTYQKMLHIAFESYLDIPLDKQRGSAISAYSGFFITNYGTNYLRYNGLMNPASSSSLNNTNSITGQGPTYGNAYPMFGTGRVFHAHAGYLMPGTLTHGHGKLMPYFSATLAKFDRLQGLWTNTYHVGLNYLIQDHKSKISLDLENRSTYSLEQGAVVSGNRKNSITLQYQIFF